MSTKFSKKNLKNPDQFQAELIKGFQWSTGHSKMVLGGVGILVIAGIIYGIVSTVQLNKEISVQEKYYQIEKQYSEKKAGFDQAAQQKEKQADKSKTPPAQPPIAASGDLQKDYGSIAENLEKLLKDSPSSGGAQMAALNLSEIYVNYKKPEEALRVLKAVETGLGHSEMLASLVLNQLGNVYANQDDCKQAIEQWQKIVNNKKLTFAHDEAKLRMGLCYEAMNDFTKAEKLYVEVSKKDDANTDFSASRDAEKYLRLLKMKKNLSGSGT